MVIIYYTQLIQPSMEELQKLVYQKVMESINEAFVEEIFTIIILVKLIYLTTFYASIAKYLQCNLIVLYNYLK